MTENDNPKPRRSLWLKFGGTAFLFLSGGTLLFFWYGGLLGSNFREVEPAKCYRSGQMSADELDKTIKQYGIKSVLNLRGEARAAWYKDETALCTFSGVKHVDLHFRLGELPHPDVLKELVAQLEGGPFPVLFHCRNGADRTGMASVLYEMVVKKRPFEEAQSQMSWQQGHIDAGKAGCMDRFFDLYRQTGTGHDIKDWIVKTYPEVYAKESSRLGLPATED